MYDLISESAKQLLWELWAFSASGKQAINVISNARGYHQTDWNWQNTSG